MGRRDGGALRFALALVAAGALAACGGDKKAPDYGPPEDTGEDPGLDVPLDVPDATDPGPGEGTTDPGPLDAPEVDAGPRTCVRDADCADAPIALDECEKKVCTKDKVCGKAWRDDCCVALTLLDEGFESGLGGWTVDDTRPGDAVAWAVTTHRKALGGKSLYLGDPRCHTYYNGALDGACKPVDPTGADASDVRASITSPAILLPALDAADTSWFLSFFLWMDAERPVGENTPDLLQVQAVVNPGPEETLHDLATSAVVQQSTGGSFVHLAADLGDLSGQAIHLRFTFDTRDANANDFEGLYLDGIRVMTACTATCTKGATCAADGQACTDDDCQPLVGQEGGICAFPPIPTCLEPECTEANVAEKCPLNEPCLKATCPDGACVYEKVPPAECCLREPLLQAGFEEGLDGFRVWAYRDNDKVRWQPSSQRASAGTGALYFGNLASRTYDNAGGFVFGEATSAPVALPATGYAFLSFDLFMATEFDGLRGDYYNPLGRDFFEVQVVANPGTAQETAVTAWSSHAVKGTTKGAFLPVGVDLTDHAGETVAIRFRFDTSDAEKNGFEGVYVDAVRVEHDPCKRRDCRGAQDCWIDGVCRTGSCADEVCQVTVVTAPPACCAVQDQCDDGNPCTTDGCIAHACVNDPFESPTCCLAVEAALWNFDGANPLAGFAVTDTSLPGRVGGPVGWIASQAQAASAPASLRFGSDTTDSYDNGGIASGTATTPLARVPPAGVVQLSFRVFLDVELVPALDRFQVEVLEGATATTVFEKVAVPGDAYDDWYAVPAISLAAWRGKDVKVRFSFDSVDASENKGRGVFVDDVRIAKVCP